MGNWTLETISWDRFDASKVDPEILRNIKAAALVERNADDYGIYLGRVFADDAAFMESVNGWVVEEIQHGMALGRWVQLADPGWDFDAAFARIRSAGVRYYADHDRSGPGEINHYYGGRGIYFDTPDGNLFELITRPYGAVPESRGGLDAAQVR